MSTLVTQSFFLLKEAAVQKIGQGKTRGGSQALVEAGIARLQGEPERMQRLCREVLDQSHKGMDRGLAQLYRDWARQLLDGARGDYEGQNGHKPKQSG